MSSILKKSARKDNRVYVDDSCTATVMSTLQTMNVQMKDLSVGGMSFYTTKPLAKEKTTLEIRFKNVKAQSIAVTGTITGIQEEKENLFRYSLQFSQRLTEEKMSAILRAAPFERFKAG